VARGARFIVLRLFVFATLYTWAECVGLLVYFWLCIRWSKNDEVRIPKIYALQNGWTAFLFACARRLLALRFEIQGEHVFHDGPIFLFFRHSSLVDTLLPGVCVAIPHHIRLRYVLKKELLWDPCLDFVGNHLPNYFVDRAGDSSSERERVGGLAAGLGPKDGVIIYPEGTRYSPAKRERILTKMSLNDHPFFEAAKEMTHVLPPRTGGPLALLEADPHADVVFCAHHGLEPFSNIRTLLSADAIGVTVNIQFWRIQRSQIPNDLDGQQDWLMSEWTRVNEFVAERSPT